MLPAGIVYPLRPRPDQTTEQYGLQLAAFVMTAGDLTLSDDQLQTAAYSVNLAVRYRFALQTTIDQLADLQRQLQATIRRRAQPTAAQDPAAGIIQSLPSDSRPDVGPMAWRDNPREPDPVGPRPTGSHSRPAPAAPKVEIPF